MAMRLNSNRSKIYQPPYTRLTTRSFVWRVASPFFGDALSPTNQLPAEVLLRIMMEVRPTQPCPPASWIQFTQVCHYWRTLSLGDPLLWTELYIPSMSAPWVCEFILRSRKAPLLLYISSHYVPGSKDSARALSVITGIMNRITNFSYYESQTTQASTWTRHLEQLHLSTSPLENLTMWGCMRMYQTWKPTSTLKYLDLNRGHFDDAFILQSLVTLKLQDLNADTLPPLSDFYRTLSSLTNLRYLVLQNVLKQIATKTKWRLPFSIPNISIPSLQELQLVHESEKECARFLSHLVSPNLTGLYIHFDNYTTPSSVLNKELVSVWTNTRLLNPPNGPPSRFVLLADTSDTRFELVSPNAPAIPDGGESLTFTETKKSLVRRSIEQLGVVKDVNSLVVLSEATVTLFPLPTFAPPTPLVKAKAAFSFAIHSSVEHVYPEGKPESLNDELSKPAAIPTLLTQLMVGCRRKVVVYSWKDGEIQEVKEAPLPHSARAIVFLDSDTACFAYSPTEYAMFSISTMTATDITTPLPTATSTTTMGTFGGLAGYMTLGLGAKSKPGVIQISDTEILIAKDNEGIPLNGTGKISRPSNIDWPAPPEEIAFIRPYILSVLPAGVLPASPGSPSPSTSATAAPAFIQTSTVQIRSALSFQQSQLITYPFQETPTPANGAPPNATIRLLTPSPSAKSPLYLLTTPTEKTAAANDGSILWQISLKSWADQIDELVLSERYADALALLDNLDITVLPDKDSGRHKIRALNAVSQFKAGQYDVAIDTFSELDLNPAKVVALYPESIAGRLSVPREMWIQLFGGPAPAPPLAPPVPRNDDSASVKSKDSSGNASHSGLAIVLPSKSLGDVSEGLASPVSKWDKVRSALTAIRKDDDNTSLSGRPRGGIQSDFHRSVETLLRYLSSKRPKLNALLESVHITPQTQSHRFAPLSETPLSDLFSLPNAPLSALTPEELLRFAQIVDTALYKSYLVNRPGLLGSLCRVPNWCEVTEVEEDLRARQKFAELVDLYRGKNTHAKALDLLRSLNEQEEDMEDRLQPSITYLQKLGPEHLQQIFRSSRWVFEQNPDMAFNIFTSEDVELPRQAVADFLYGIDPKICARYLEYIIAERSEEDPVSHNRLAELYLNLVMHARRRNDERARQETYQKMLEFVKSNQLIALDWFYGLISSTDLYEARAILLGRLGRHDQALEIYVYKLHDYLKAEEYCKHVYKPNTPTQSVFLTLLRIYLRPTNSPSDHRNLLHPALDLISRHGPRLDSVETLELLPPLVTVKDVSAFSLDALRMPIFDTMVMKNVAKAHNDNVARRLMLLQTKRVKVTDSRICPHCHKRIGNSVIAAHAPRGEVTHYQCREAFSKKLMESRNRI
ncbi:hypothetical protein AX16_010742 [Volvariella volvacea WC 439]|nr:hypothetical protein AX16_010742 [Volvariella volvacea WC 439]